MNKLMEVAKEYLYEYHIYESQKIKRENVKLFSTQDLDYKKS